MRFDIGKRAVEVKEKSIVPVSAGGTDIWSATLFPPYHGQRNAGC
jgi:hypothetical protein